ncbi:hypothetical protein [Planctobacterium marinum]|uniref:hypothetical protein n=1 Tax=Planctobacterium marinum TaxID=1631968 RepID=UPI00361EB172
MPAQARSPSGKVPEIQYRKHHNLIIAAIAREMAAYIWAIAKEVVLTPVNPKLRLSRVPA